MGVLFILFAIQLAGFEAGASIPKDFSQSTIQYACTGIPVPFHAKIYFDEVKEEWKAIVAGKNGEDTLLVVRYRHLGWGGFYFLMTDRGWKFLTHLPKDARVFVSVADFVKIEGELQRCIKEADLDGFFS